MVAVVDAMTPPKLLGSSPSHRVRPPRSTISVYLSVYLIVYQYTYMYGCSGVLRAPLPLLAQEDP
eukprot:9108352-Pyramimonas_sp.AAC.1